MKKKITYEEFDKRFDSGEDVGDIFDVRQTKEKLTMIRRTQAVAVSCRSL